MSVRVIAAALQTVVGQNRLWSRLMSGTDASHPAPPPRSRSAAGRAERAAGGGGCVRSRRTAADDSAQRRADHSVDPGIACVLGVFLLFGLATGHVRIGETRDALDFPPPQWNSSSRA